MFRYERPQKGRFRQFHQIGVEFLGATHPFADAEVIACGYQILCDLGIADDVRLEINTLGDNESRARYREALVTYLRRFASDLSLESQTRLEKNPLRILDSKDAKDRAIIADAPRIGDYLTLHARGYYETLQTFLRDFAIPFVENPQIVRGLDYYSYTAFEFITTRLGAQGTVMAGGRYQGLIAEMGGPEVGGVGFAAGIERLAMLLAAAPPAPQPVLVHALPMGYQDEGARAAIPILKALHDAGIAAEYSYYVSLKRALGRASEAGVPVAVIVGGAPDPDVEEGMFVVRDLRRREQTTHDEIEDVVTQVKKLLAGGA
jgi:histidyl-tRNA synthetase